MIAHQRLIREQRAITDAGEGLFGAYWEDINRDIGNALVREIDRRTAESVILKYEWLGCMPAVSYHCFGIYYDEVLAGVVVYGPEYSENLGILARERGIACADWSRYGYEGKMILLSRGACVHWAHPHSASKLIRRSMALLPEKYEVVTATVDEAAGEIGTIYQAAGFDYVGSMRDRNAKVNSRRLDRDGWLINGKILGSRSLRQMLGNARRDEVLRAFPDAVFVPQHAKQRYFAFRGPPAIKRRNRAAIAHLIQPYPKRAVGVGETGLTNQSGRAGAMPARRSINSIGSFEEASSDFAAVTAGQFGTDLDSLVPIKGERFDRERSDRGPVRDDRNDEVSVGRVRIDPSGVASDGQVLHEEHPR